MKRIKHALLVGAIWLALLVVAVLVTRQVLIGGLLSGLALLASSPIALILLYGAFDEIIWAPKHPCHYCTGHCSFPKTEICSSWCEARAKEIAKNGIAKPT
jgi:hypothetical protein